MRLNMRVFTRSQAWLAYLILCIFGNLVETRATAASFTPLPSDQINSTLQTQGSTPASNTTRANPKIGFVFPIPGTRLTGKASVDANMRLAYVEVASLLRATLEQILDEHEDPYEEVDGTWDFEDPSPGIDTVLRVFDPLATRRRLDWANVEDIIRYGLEPLMIQIVRKLGRLGVMDIDIYRRDQPERVFATIQIVRSPFVDGSGAANNVSMSVQRRGHRFQGPSSL